MSEHITAAPVGLIKHTLWMQTRLVDIKQAIERYEKAGRDIPEVWVEESEMLKIEIDQ